MTTENKSSAQDHSSTHYTDEEKKRYGYDLYPERDVNYKSELTLKSALSGKRESVDKYKCQYRVRNVLQNSPFVKLFVSALNSAGCTFDVDRHVSCEVCSPKVIGGYDPTNNQVVICQNVCVTEKGVEHALSHELVHMFDYCKHKLDFKNLEHLACTEIRAAALTSCSFLSSLRFPKQHGFAVKDSNKDCVKMGAAHSVSAVRDISVDQALEVVDKVFNKCYNDLEPVGRIIRRGSRDAEKAYRERHIYGYA